MLFPLSMDVSAGETLPGSVISTSPDTRFRVLRDQAPSGEQGQVRKSLSITDSSGKVLYNWISPLGPTTVLWNGDSRFLAVSDALERGGDRLWVFALKDGGIDPLRIPDGTALRHQIEERHGTFLSDLGEILLRPVEWRSGRLWCEVSGVFIPKREQSIHVPFRYLWVYTVRRGSLVLDEEWTRTFPAGRAFRNP